jgi:hypothetical protein
VARKARNLNDDWPPQSPDLNPIEHVWHALKNKIREIEPDFHELKDNVPHKAWAEEIIQRAWSELDPEHICRLIESMPRKLAAVKKITWVLQPLLINYFMFLIWTQLSVFSLRNVSSK